MSATANLPHAGLESLTPGAGGVSLNSVDARVPDTARGRTTQSSGPACSSSPSPLNEERAGVRSESAKGRPDQRQPIVSFTSAYWDRIMGRTPDEPEAADYGLSEPHAEMIRRACMDERRAQLYIKHLQLAACQSPSVKGLP